MVSKLDSKTNQPSILVLIVSAFLAIILQLVLAPVISLFGVVPNFIMIVVIITAINNGPVRSTIFGFLMGLIFDLFSLGPVGGMALVLTITGFGVSSLNKSSFTGGIVVDMIVLLIALALSEFLASVVYAIVGVNQEFLLSLVQRVLPAIVYDAVLGFILLLIYKALVREKPSRMSGMGGGSGRMGGSGGSGRIGGSGGGRSLTRKLNM